MTWLKNKLSAALGAFGYILYLLIGCFLVFSPLITLQWPIWASVLFSAVVMFIPVLGDFTLLAAWVWSFVFPATLPEGLWNIPYYLSAFLYFLFLVPTLSFPFAWLLNKVDEHQYDKDGNPKDILPLSVMWIIQSCFYTVIGFVFVFTIYLLFLRLEVCYDADFTNLFAVLTAAFFILLATCIYKLCMHMISVLDRPDLIKPLAILIFIVDFIIAIASKKSGMNPYKELIAIELYLAHRKWKKGTQNAPVKKAAVTAEDQPAEAPVLITENQEKAAEYTPKTIPEAAASRVKVRVKPHASAHTHDNASNEK